MTDKQIIIDGVDVSRCEYLQQEDIDHDYTCYAEEGYQSGEICCSACTNCYYKQLKRKEQECERLKAWKKEHLKDVEFIERNPVIDILNLMADKILLEQRNDKLSQTLAKIKELLLKTPTDSQEHCVNAKSVILQKISEVEDEEN